MCPAVWCLCCRNCSKERSWDAEQMPMSSDSSDFRARSQMHFNSWWISVSKMAKESKSVFWVHAHPNHSKYRVHLTSLLTHSCIIGSESRGRGKFHSVSVCYQMSDSQGGATFFFLSTSLISKHRSGYLPWTLSVEQRSNRAAWWSLTLLSPVSCLMGMVSTNHKWLLEF